MQAGSEKLMAADEAIRTFAARREVGPTVRIELEELAATIEPIRLRLAEIEDLYAIDFGSDVDDGISTASDLWGKAPTGHIRGTALAEIRKSSPLLSALYVRGVDIQHAYKFGPSEKKLAFWFGTHIDATTELLRALRKEKRSTKDETEWSAIMPMSTALKPAIRMLQNEDVIHLRRILVRTREGRWKPFRIEWLRDDPEARILLVYEKRNAALLRFLKGEWMNSYVHDIIDDQLMRHDVPYELYTQVSYKAPADLIRAASDFDVVGRVRDTIVSVECKSGRLDPDRGDFDDLVQRAGGVRSVLSTMGAEEVNFLFFVVYDPEMNSEDQMVRLTEHGIRPLRLDQVRPIVAETFEAALH